MTGYEIFYASAACVSCLLGWIEHRKNKVLLELCNDMFEELYGHRPGYATCAEDGCDCADHNAASAGGSHMKGNTQ